MNKHDTATLIADFWTKFPSHISFLEQSVKLGHNEEFKGRYESINDTIKEIHPALQVEFGVDMMEAKVNAIVVTAKAKGEARRLSHAIAAGCPDSLKELVTPYRLPALPWETEVSKSWVYDMCRQFGMQSVATQVGDCLADATCAVKLNDQNGKVLIQFALKNKRELKAVDTELVLLMFDLLLGEQIIAEAIDILKIKTLKELHGKKGDWVITNGLGVRDAVLHALM
ncbi:TPA: hypothetical protein ACGSTL_001180 [Vibrio parahaemolyticus]|uniref:hypothetical protein n=1 Tax=Vibrio campbellii TaxID=680 RepID=UPI001F071E0A|nr:hypothetical protein [Vibrio campbellii]UMM06603.1 hypothetical protein MKR81_27020 [Vibrio campbellii]